MNLSGILVPEKCGEMAAPISVTTLSDVEIVGEHASARHSLCSLTELTTRESTPPPLLVGSRGLVHDWPSPWPPA
jgi:hypothetical protein